MGVCLWLGMMEGCRFSREAMMASPSDNERARLFQLAGTGAEFFGSVLGSVLAGYFLDRWLNWTPVLTLVGVALGFTVGLMKLVAVSRSSMKPTTPKAGPKANPKPSPKPGPETKK